jgi:hypothetical protein
MLVVESASSTGVASLINITAGGGDGLSNALIATSLEAISTF